MKGALQTRILRGDNLSEVEIDILKYFIDRFTDEIDSVSELALPSTQLREFQKLLLYNTPYSLITQCRLEPIMPPDMSRYTPIGEISVRWLGNINKHFIRYKPPNNQSHDELRVRLEIQLSMAERLNAREMLQEIGSIRTSLYEVSMKPSLKN